MNRRTTYEVMKTTFHYDGGHQWLKVSSEQMQRVDILLNQISHYSYVDNDNPPTYYLEGDCHAELFINTARDQGIEVVWTNHDDGNESFIRNLDRIKPKPTTLATALKKEAINRGFGDKWLDDHLEVIEI